MGVGLGLKTIDEKSTQESAIVFYVKEKKEVPPSQTIPKKIEGCLTDVRSTGSEFKLHPRKIQASQMIEAE